MRKYVSIMAVLLMVTAIASAQGVAPYNWVGGTDLLWATGANWDDGAGLPAPAGGPGLPGSLVTDDAIFNTGAAVTYTVTLGHNVDDGLVPAGAGMGNIDVQNDRVKIDIGAFNLITAGDNVGNRTMWVGCGAGNVGELEITGTGNFYCASGLSVGDSGGDGKCTFSGGVQAAIRYKLYAGGSSSTGGDLTFTGAGTHGACTMFYYGKGTLLVSDGATLNFDSNSGGHIGIMGCSQTFDATEGPTTFTVTGAGSAFSSTANGGGILMGYAQTAGGSTINVLDGASYTNAAGNNPLNPAKGGSVTAINVLGTGSYMQTGTIELGGHDNTAYPQKFCGNHNTATSTLTVGLGAVLDVDAQNAAIADLVKYNNASVISVAGTINIVDGSLLLNGTAGQAAASSGDLHIQFDETDHGMIICSNAGSTADIANVPIVYSLTGGGPFNPASPGFMDFIIADTFIGGGLDNMAAVLVGSSIESDYAYGIVTVAAGDYAADLYAGLDALRLQWPAPQAGYPGDADGDGDVDDADLALLLNGWGSANPGWGDGDFDGDGDVDDADLAQLLNNWGTTPPLEAVPEPATMALLSLGALALIRRNRK